MNLDIVLVTYNSSKWVMNCLNSLRSSSYPISQLHLTIVDNYSTDDTCRLIEQYPIQDDFGSYQLIRSPSNLGFGKANNLAVERAKHEYIFFLNIDTEVEPDCFSQLEKTIQSSSEDIALWECRQFPYEHPKYYNPVTLETTWASGAACVVRRSAFLEVGMFDERIFMYAEDVDLSWRLRAKGYKLQYTPRCIVNHYTYQSAGEVKPNQFYNSTYNNLMLRYKFGSKRDIVKGYILYSGLLAIPRPFKGHRRKIAQLLVKSLGQGVRFRKRNRFFREGGFQSRFRIWDYEIVREGAFYVNERTSTTPLVSIIVRTCGRPDVLREALQSIRHQTYPNIEVVIVEDGPALSEKMVRTEFADLRVNYKATEVHVGRCVAGNKALSGASGQYFNFLDDDDVLFADHVEVLMHQLQQNPACQAAYAIGFETPIKIHSKSPYKYEEIYHNVVHRQQFNKLVLLHHNYFPIQTVMFSRRLFDDFGGFDPELEVLEDWDLWLRYALKSEFHFVEKVTSMYRVPSEASLNSDRQALLDKYLYIVRNKHATDDTMLPVKSILVDIEGIISRGNVVMSQIKRGRFDVLFIKSKNATKRIIRRFITKSRF
ncbi:glycosyltransferase family 2 protein [Cohnella fermenti]|uniref:Glycosyltransferase family 2 protein n=1 Tax=Cohnella fermenti TaxID=2565925 RepID=A0A4S4C574_9BACL|nr:glycosyltransferase family 2 protein [Cohnella fermenti]